MTQGEFQRRCEELRQRMGVYLRTVEVPKLVRLKYKPAECPRCRNENTKRRGIALTGKQNHWCFDCRKHFTGGMTKTRPKGSNRHGLMCYWCGGTDNIISQGNDSSGGRCGHCQACNKYFTQGGRFDLERYHLLLSDRISKLRLPKAVAAELFQAASLDVLMGVGYCWTVPLNVAAAHRAVNGEFGQQGSDHPAYKMHNGQRFTKDNT